MAPPRKSARLARELAEAPLGRLRKRFLNPHVVFRLCELADEKTNCGDRDGLRVARLCCRLAQQLKSGEARALSFARLATALRMANRLGHGEQALAVAFAAAPDWHVGDLFRRRAWIRIYQGRLAEAIWDGREALKRTSGPDKAMAHETLGVALYTNGDHQAGLREFEQCLAATNPDAETAYCNALHNYATALAKGTDEQAGKALALCAEMRSKLRDRHKQQRAKLWWTEGLIHERLGDLQQAWRSLNIARRSLIALEAAPELAAIVADMARIGAEPPAVRHICSEAATVISVPHPLAGPLGELAVAPRETIPIASAALHEAASRLAVCPVL